MSMLRMNQVTLIIRRDGSANIVLDGKTINVGFQGQGKEGTLVMVGGGYYKVRTTDGTVYEIGKGKLVEVH